MSKIDTFSKITNWVKITNTETLCLDRVARNNHWLRNLWPCSTSRSNRNSAKVLVFVEGGKPEDPEKNPRRKVRTNNKLNPHETASTGIEPGSQRWEASAYPLHQPSFPKIKKHHSELLLNSFPMNGHTLEVLP